MLLYSVTGDHFQFGSRITWSIAPDGTLNNGVGSNLISTLNSEVAPNSGWLPAVQDAFAEWEEYANINLAQVGDSGQPFDSGIIQQDSPFFGDIRIGGMPQAPGTLASTMLPPGANGGSNSGDIMINTTLPWGTNGYDLETVLVHEIGHALGMGHSTNPYAAMYVYYGGPEPFATSDDIAGIRSIWGPRAEDPFVQNFANLNMAHAADVTGFMTSTNGQVYLPGLNVASTSESYWFKFTTPANSSSVFTAQVQSTSLSELSPQVQVYNASGAGLASFTAPAWAYGATINATISNATPNTTYYVKVSGSNAGDSGTGSYTLFLNAGYQFIPTGPAPNTLVFAQPDQGGGSDPLTVGGIGTWIKDWVMSGETLDLSSFGLQNDTNLTAILTSIEGELSGPNAPTADQLDSILDSELQQISAGILDGTTTVSTKNLDKILTNFFTHVQSDLAGSISSSGKNK